MAWDSGMGGGDKPDRPDKPERPDKDRPSDWFSSKKPSDVDTIDQLIDEELAAEAEQARRDSETSTESEPEPSPQEQHLIDGGEVTDAATDDPAEPPRVTDSDEGQGTHRPVTEGDQQDHSSLDAWDDSDPWENSIDQTGSTDTGDQPAEPDEHVERADSRHEVKPPQAVVDYYTNILPSDRDKYQVLDQDNPIPFFDGKPTREQVRQGLVGDCGIVATLGAVAGHMPDSIGKAFKKVGDGEYEVTLHQVTESSDKDPVARPTGDTITYRVNDEIPIVTEEGDRYPLGVEADVCGWPALMEKVIAAEDQTWDDTKKAAWEHEWVTHDKPAVDAERAAEQLEPSPDTAPTGYNRLDIGSTPYHRADLLARLTGHEAEVRKIPGEQQGEQALVDAFSDQLTAGKPILVGARSEQRPAEWFPTDVAPGHAYEVTKIEDGKIHLRNPWGDSHNPAPMDAKTFLEYYRWYNYDGTRDGDYTTLR